MLKRRIRTLAVTGITIVAAAVVTLSTTAAASAATTTSSTSTACVYRDFGESSTYQVCVRDEQILLNDLWKDHVAGPNQLLTVDGYYGNLTTLDVKSFQAENFITPDGITGPVTWSVLCEQDWFFGFTGTYWHAVGCPAVY
jgi:peptidoglycan hydrolase-like protein with peptidoglycan-binding domain